MWLPSPFLIFQVLPTILLTCKGILHERTLFLLVQRIRYVIINPFARKKITELSRISRCHLLFQEEFISPHWIKRSNYECYEEEGHNEMKDTSNFPCSKNWFLCACHLLNFIQLPCAAYPKISIDTEQRIWRHERVYTPLGNQTKSLAN